MWDARAARAVAAAVVFWLVAVLDRTAEMLAEKFPVQAVTHIRAHPDQVTGRMFNQSNWDGHLPLSLTAHLVFINGRADFLADLTVSQTCNLVRWRSGNATKCLGR